MRIMTDPLEIQAWSARERCQGRIIGLVPTMGFFHEGHLALFRWAREHCDVLVVSLFVNPTQFSPQEDLDSYPRDMERDTLLAEEEGVDVLFAPAPVDMYASNHATWVEAPLLARGLCAAQRPTHFQGVATVVVKLFLLTNPTVAVFGEKDWQQLAVIRRVTQDLNIPVEVAARPTVREADGLAMSSRNVYLSAQERRQAPAIYQGLLQARERIHKGEANAMLVLNELSAMFTQTMPMATIDYLALVDPDQLSPLEEVRLPALLAVAVKFGKARLIDNILISAGKHL